MKCVTYGLGRLTDVWATRNWSLRNRLCITISVPCEAEFTRESCRGGKDYGHAITQTWKVSPHCGVVSRHTHFSDKEVYDVRISLERSLE